MNGALLFGYALVALSAVLGWAAATAVFAFALGELLSRSVPRQRALQLRVLLSLPLFAIGSSAVLRYATGSPWPLIH